MTSAMGSAQRGRRYAEASRWLTKKAIRMHSINSQYTLNVRRRKPASSNTPATHKPR